MLKTITTDAFTVVREQDENRNELRFEFSPTYEVMAERAHTDEHGNVDEIAIDQLRIDTVRAACAMLTAWADSSDADLGRVVAGQ